MSSEEVYYSKCDLPNEISGACFISHDRTLTGAATDKATFEDVCNHVELMSKHFRKNLLITIEPVTYGHNITWGPYPERGE